MASKRFFAQALHADWTLLFVVARSSPLFRSFDVPRASFTAMERWNGVGSFETRPNRASTASRVGVYRLETFRAPSFSHVVLERENCERFELIGGFID